MHKMPFSFSNKWQSTMISQFSQIFYTVIKGRPPRRLCWGNGVPHLALTSHQSLTPDGPPSRSLCQLLYKSQIQLHRTVCHWGKKKKLSAVMVLWASLQAQDKYSETHIHTGEMRKRATPFFLWPRPRETLFLPCFAFAQAASIHFEMGCNCKCEGSRVQGSRVQVSSRLGALLGLPTLSLVDWLHATGGGFGSILNGSLSLLWPASVGLFICLDFGPCPLFLLLSLCFFLSSVLSFN